MKTILVGYDGTRPAQRALNRAAEVARAFDSRVLVVSVAPAPPQPIESMAAGGAFGLMPYSYPAEDLAEPVHRDEALWQQHRDRVQALFAGAGIPVEFVGVGGQPAEAILEVAEAHQADLRWRAHCDVLIVHQADESGSEHGQ
jgi:nucleotide-binding universal stress UspA family protein